MEYDILYHARTIDKYSSDRINYPKEDWIELLSHYKNLKVAAIGTLDGADWFEGTTDLRDNPLDVLCNTMASSKMIIGPSSGPMHLAALCALPTVVWSGYARSRPRYETIWNPFETPVTVISPDDDPWGQKKEWQPNAADIHNAIEKAA